MRYASTHVALCVTDKLLASQRSELVSYVTSSYWLLPESARQSYIFEGLAHAALRNGGKMRIRELGHGDRNTSSIRLPRLQPHSFQDVSQVDLTQDRYYYPLSKNVAAVDSISPAGLFLITVSPDCPIKAEQLTTLVEQLGLTRLYFVVPPALFDSFASQSFVAQDGKVIEPLPSPLDAVKLFALDLQL